MFIKNKIKIFSREIPIDLLKNYISIFPKNLPSYYKNIPRQCPFHLNYKNFNPNIRNCPGFLNYYKRSIVFKSPYDIVIDIDHKNNILDARFGKDSANDSRKISIHSNDQLLNHINQDKYSFIIKLSFQINIQSDIPLLVNGDWYSMNDFDIVPGVLYANNPVDLNPFIAVKKNQNHIFIKQNTPLLIMHTESKKNIKLSFEDKIIDSRFFNGKYYLFSDLKDRLLKNKFFIK